MSRITRRAFVSDVAKASLAATILPRHVLGGPGFQAPSDTLNIAIIGAGGMGASNARELLTENIVAIVDVDFEHVESTLERMRDEEDPRRAAQGRALTEAYARAARYADFRRMLDERRDVDAVVIATPDHTHAVAAKQAMELGKHVYVQKPLTWSIHEARVLRETAERTGVVTQMGNQGRSTVERFAIDDWIQSGVIGPVREVHTWTNRPIWPQGVPRPGAAQPREEEAEAGSPLGRPVARSWRRFEEAVADAMHGTYPIPTHLDWDLFLGPAPAVAYHPIYHPFNWRGWVDWGVGALGDMGAHLIDHPFSALRLGYPSSVEATSSPWGGDRENPATYPEATLVTYEFPARGAMPPATLTWYDGGLMPPRHPLIPVDYEFDRGGGVLFVGERGVLVHGTYGQDPRLFPDALMEEHGPAPETDDDIGPRHEMNWVDAIKGVGEATSPFSYAAPLTEVMLLGLVALRAGPGRSIHYDPVAMSITNVPEADRYLHREYRAGWTL